MKLSKFIFTEQFAISLALMSLGLTMALWGIDKLGDFFSKYFGISTVNALTGLVGWVYLFFGVVFVVLGMITLFKKRNIAEEKACLKS